MANLLSLKGIYTATHLHFHEVFEVTAKKYASL